MGELASSFSPKPTYLVLRPELATKKDLFLLLVSSNLENRQFVGSSAAREPNFYTRWLMFISTVVRIFLRYSATALAVIGWAIETWLNFLSYNPTVRSFIGNLFKWTFLLPRDSEKFVSFLGYLDNPAPKSSSFASKATITTQSSLRLEERSHSMRTIGAQVGISRNVSSTIPSPDNPALVSETPTAASCTH